MLIVYVLRRKYLPYRKKQENIISKQEQLCSRQDSESISIKQYPYKKALIKTVMYTSKVRFRCRKNDTSITGKTDEKNAPKMPL